MSNDAIASLTYEDWNLIRRAIDSGIACGTVSVSTWDPAMIEFMQEQGYITRDARPTVTEDGRAVWRGGAPR